MQYKATLVKKELVNGRLKVTIEYSNGIESFNETMECRCSQDSDWAEKEASRRCKELENLIVFANTIQLGEIKIQKEKECRLPKTPYDIYKRKLELFLKAQSALRLEIITEEAESFSELKNWLSDNSKPEYLELFIG